MQIYSWNVAGLRSALKKGFLDWFEKTDPDVLCLQEIRVTWDQLDAPTRAILSRDRSVAWFDATSKKGYSGTAVLSKKKLGLEHQVGLGVEEFDVEGRSIFSFKPGLLILSAYFPNASTGLVRLPYKRRFSEKVAEISRARGREGLIVMGDLNVAPEEIDLANPKPNRGKPGFTDEEREDFRGYLSTGLRDVFRDRHPGEKGHYSWWSQRTNARDRNIGWRLDIALAHASLGERVRGAAIHSDVLGSDHCPVSVEVDG